MAMVIFTLAILLFISFLIFIWQVSNIISVIFGSPFVNAKTSIVQEALKEAGLKRSQIFYELGCSDGRVLVEASKYGVEAIGFEIALWPFLIGKIRTCFIPNIKIYNDDIKRVDLRNADYVYCYLLPDLLKKITPKFQKELKKNAKIISIAFPLDESIFGKPQIIEPISKKKSALLKAYIYTK